MVLTQSLDLIVIESDFCNFADSSLLFEVVKSFNGEIKWVDIGFKTEVLSLFR